MKNLAMLIVTLGVALCASFGAKLAPSVSDSLTAEGASGFLAEQEKAAKAEYCTARRAAKLALDPACEPSVGEPSDSGHGAKTLRGRVSAARAALAQMRADRRLLPRQVAEKATAWLNIREALIEPQALMDAGSLPPPRVRIAEWFSVAGGGFLLGLLLVCGGSFMARRAVHGEVTASHDEGGAIDFAEALAQLRQQVASLHGELVETSDDSVSKFERIRDGIGRVNLDLLEPIVEARARLAHRYGTAGYAAVFSPFSAAERSINRAWSALVDMHPPEALESLRRALEQLDAAVEAFDALKVVTRG